MQTDFAKLNETLKQIADEQSLPTVMPRTPTQLEEEAAARYNAMNRHQRRVFDANAKKMMRQKKRTVAMVAARQANKA